MQLDYYHSPCAPEPLEGDPSPIDTFDVSSPARPRRRRRGMVTLAVFLALIVLLGAALTVARLTADEDRSSPWAAVWERLDELPFLDEFTDSFSEHAPDTAPPQPTASTAPAQSLPAADPAPEVELVLSAAPGEAMSYRDIYYKVLPSIVSIEAYGSYTGSTGTGVIMAETGYIVTNHHIIEDCSTAEVVLHDGARYEAKLVGSDAESDLAVLKIEADGLTAAEFGSSDRAEVGDTVLAIGNPLGSELFGTMTEGIISAIDRDVNVSGYTMSLIQTTAALNPGNSGGALINISGQVIGITNLKMMSSYETIEGLGFAIPTVWAKEVVDTLLDQGVITGRPTIGITCYTTTALQSGHDGVCVSTVTSGGPADKAGLRPDDIIIAANGRATPTLEDLTLVRDEVGVGGTMELTVWRNGETLELPLVLIDQYELN